MHKISASLCQSDKCSIVYKKKADTNRMSFELDEMRRKVLTLTEWASVQKGKKDETIFK